MSLPSSRVLAEEIFGPVAPIVSFDTEDEAIAAANDTEYGLMAYVFTRDLNRGLRVIEALDTGMVGLNQGVTSNSAAPFGGVKQSGFGREGGAEGIEEYLSREIRGDRGVGGVGERPVLRQPLITLWTVATIGALSSIPAPVRIGRSVSPNASKAACDSQMSKT